MQDIHLDATHWATPLDFYAALLPALGAPEWHSSSVQSVVDPMIGGEINAVEPPYTVKISNLAGKADVVAFEVNRAKDAIERARNRKVANDDELVEAYLEILS